MGEPVFRTKGFALFDWQNDAVRAWVDAPAPLRGTLEIFTGGGKSLIALACAAEAARRVPPGAFRLLVVVPTTALAEQWVATIAAQTTLASREIGLLATRDAATAFDRFVAVVAVINTAARLAKDRAFELDDATMLVVDECHRAGAPSFRHALDLGKRFRLGLSATPEREELGDDGEPLVFDEQIVAKKLGGVVFSFDLAAARAAGRLPTYEIRHHGVSLDAAERADYDARSGEVDDVARRLRAAGVEPGRARALIGKSGPSAELARAYLLATAARKDLLYRARERERITLAILRDALRDPSARVLLFNERIDAVASLAALLRDAYGAIVEAEHSQLPARERRRVLERFRSGDARVLVSAKSLIEGIDVPDATVGISVASTASVRQRVQALGRVLRKGVAGKRAAMHLVYVSDTVDESIYEKEDWSDLTGESLNVYLRWPYGTGEPVRSDEPPKRPRPTEEQMAESFRVAGTAFPAPWPGAISGQEYSVDTRGNVKNAFGIPIADARGVAAMVAAARGTPGGRFRVTPKHRFVLVFCREHGAFVWKAAGRLDEPFASREAPAVLSPAARDDMPGEVYFGKRDRSNGEFRLRARAGGVIERRRAGGVAVARFARDAADRDARRVAASEIVARWRRLKLPSLRFYVNDERDAWFERDGDAIFLAHVGDGFEFDDVARDVD